MRNYESEQDIIVSVNKLSVIDSIQEAIKYKHVVQEVVVFSREDHTQQMDHAGIDKKFVQRVPTKDPFIPNIKKYPKRPVKARKDLPPSLRMV